MLGSLCSLCILSTICDVFCCFIALLHYSNHQLLHNFILNHAIKIISNLIQYCLKRRMKERRCFGQRKFGSLCFLVLVLTFSGYLSTNYRFGSLSAILVHILYFLFLIGKSIQLLRIVLTMINLYPKSFFISFHLNKLRYTETRNDSQPP